MSQWVAKVFDFTELFGDRVNTGCIFKGGESSVTAKTQPGTANVVILLG